LLGIVVPDWQKVLAISSQVARALGLGLLGIDIVFDPIRGPILLEANARPGLNIQIANDAGLYSRFQEIDSLLDG
jgi:glutathione synthase/RimK-type ligase-like ATP-grasp enzyme